MAKVRLTFPYSFTGEMVSTLAAVAYHVGVPPGALFVESVHEPVASTVVRLSGPKECLQALHLYLKANPYHWWEQAQEEGLMNDFSSVEIDLSEDEAPAPPPPTVPDGVFLWSNEVGEA